MQLDWVLSRRQDLVGDYLVRAPLWGEVWGEPQEEASLDRRHRLGPLEVGGCLGKRRLLRQELEQDYSRQVRLKGIE